MELTNLKKVILYKTNKGYLSRNRGTFMIKYLQLHDFLNHLRFQPKLLKIHFLQHIFQ